MRRISFALLSAVAFLCVCSSQARAEKILTITSDPVGARVEINGQTMGNTPIQTKMKEFYFNGPKYLWSEFLNAPVQITVSKEGYVPQTLTITNGPYRWVNANYTAEKIYYVIKQTDFYIKLEPAGATGLSPLAGNLTPIVITSEPPGAEIQVDGQFDSSTPSKLLLLPGEHTIRVSRPGFRSWERKIAVVPGAEKTFNALLDSETAASKSAAAPATGQTSGEQKPEVVVSAGHAGGVSALAFSPDGTLLASGDSDGAIKLWEVKSGRGLRTFAEESMEASIVDDGVYALAFSPDGKMLASATAALAKQTEEGQSLKTELKLWDVVSGRVLNSFAVQGKIMSLAFSPVGRFLAGGGADKTVTLWNLTDGATRTFTGRVAEVNFVMFTPDGTQVYSGDWSKAIDVWNPANGTVLKELAGFPALAGGGNTLADLTAIVGPKPIFNPFINRFVTGGSFAGAISLRDGNNLTTLKEFRWEKDVIQLVAISQSGKILAGAGLTGSIKLWDVASGAELQVIKEGQSGDVIAMSPDNRIIALTSEEGKTIKLWDTNNEITMKPLTGHTADINTLAFSPNSKLLASGSDDKTIKLWEVESGRVKTLTGHTDAVGPVAFHPTGKFLASIADNLMSEGEEIEDKAIHFWDVENGTQVKALTVAASAPTAIAFSPDGTVLAVGNMDGTISLLDLATGTVAKTLAGNIGQVGALIFTNAETLQSICINDSETIVEINLWHVVTGKVLKTNRLDLSDVASFSSKEAIFLGNLSFMAVSEKFYAFPQGGKGITLYAKSPGVLFDPTSEQAEVASLFIFDDNDWLVTTPDGFFDGSPAAWKHVGWRFNNNTFDYGAVELYFNEFFYPDLLQNVLAGKPPKPPAGRTLAQLDRRQPEVNIAAIDGQSVGGLAAPAVNQLQTDKRLTTLTIEVTDNLAEPKRAEHAASSGAQDLRLFRNGSLVHVWPDDLFKLGAKDGCEQFAPKRPDEPRRVQCRVEVKVVAGANQFTAYAFNRVNVRTEDSRVDIKGAATLKRERVLYVLAIGVGQYENPQFDLNYTTKDAQEFGAAMQYRQGQIGYYQRVEVIPVVDQAAKKADILAALKRLATAQPEDGVIIYFSGHGTAQGDRFYLIPHDIGYKGARGQVDAAGLQMILAHSISDLELEAALRDIDAERLLIVIDACNSGKALQADDWRRGPMNTKGLGQLAYEKGMYVLTASQDAELAYESETLQHSYLTYALVEEGLKMKATEADANANDDELISLREWFDFAKQRVPRLRQEQVARVARQQNKSLEEVEVIEQGRVQRPRVFYRREPELQPFIIMRVVLPRKS